MVAGVGVAVAGLLDAIFVPVNSESRQIQVTSDAGASATLSLPSSTWVPLQFSHHGSMPMMYWMEGLGGGMMFPHQGMMGGDSFSFWSNSGNFRCWAGYEGAGMTPVWVNATRGLL